MKLDDLDYSILKELSRNGRISFSDLGKQIGLSSPAVAQRMAKLEEAGVIEGYQPIINDAALGKILEVFVSLRLKTGCRSLFSEKVKGIAGITDAYLITGDDCVILKANLEGPEALVMLLDELQEYGETRSSVALRKLI